MDALRTGFKITTKGIVGAGAGYTGYQYYSTTHIFLTKAHAELPSGLKAAVGNTVLHEEKGRREVDDLSKWHDNTGC